MTPQLSVIIPTYKRSDSLEKLLDCLSSQVNIKLEIIVVDQNEAGYFKPKLTSKLSGIIHIHQKVPNASLARNNGFKKSSAQYILFLDDDLIPDSDFCIRGLKIFEEFPLIKCFVPLVYSQKGKEVSLLYAQNKIIKKYPNSNSVFSVTDEISAAVFFEREYFVLSGGFDIYLFDFAKTSEDMELFFRMRKRKLTLWFVPGLEIFHDDEVEGGCELRSSNYWVSRQKNVKALALFYRIHNSPPGKVSLKNLMQLIRFTVVNIKSLQSGSLNIIKEIQLLKRSIKESKFYFSRHSCIYFNSLVSFLN